MQENWEINFLGYLWKSILTLRWLQNLFIFAKFTAPFDSYNDMNFLLRKRNFKWDEFLIFDKEVLKALTVSFMKSCIQQFYAERQKKSFLWIKKYVSSFFF